MCNTDNYSRDTIALIDYIVDENEAGCSLINMVKAKSVANSITIEMF